MFRTAWKGLLGHKSRFVATALAVTLGVAFMAGTLVLTDTIREYVTWPALQPRCASRERKNLPSR